MVDVVNPYLFGQKCYNTKYKVLFLLEWQKSVLVETLLYLHLLKPSIIQ